MSLDSRANPIISHYYSLRCFCDSSNDLKKGHRGEADNQKIRITRGWHGVLFFAKTNPFGMADSPFIHHLPMVRTGKNFLRKNNMPRDVTMLLDDSSIIYFDSLYYKYLS